MKAFAVGTLAVVVLSIAAALILGELGYSSAEFFATSNVRL